MSSKSQKWLKHVEDWQASGLSSKEFCVNKGLSTSQFGYWKKHFSQLVPPVVASNDFVSQDFAKVIVSESERSDVRMIVITTSSGCRLEIPA
jgi:hypothetical protein